jgi:CHAT domain-containing protein
LSIALRSTEEARALCEQSLARARSVAELTNFGPGAAETAASEVTALLDLARLQRALGRHAAARPLVDSAERLVQKHRVKPNNASYFLRVASGLASEAGDHERAVSLAEQAVAMWHTAGRAPNASPLLQARVALHQVLVAGRDWGGALRELEVIEAALVGQRGARVRPGMLAQALTYAHAGRLAGLQPQLDAAASTWHARLGPDHPQVAVLRGLYGAAVWAAAADGDNDARASGRQRLSDASARLLEAMRQSDPYLDGAIEGQAARFVLEQFLRAQQQGQPSPSEFQLAFRVADVLRGSKVQTAMQDAALRMASTNGPLSELVRRETTLRNEIRALDDQLSGRTDSGAETGRAQLAKLKVERQTLRTRIASSHPALAALMNPAAPSPDDVVRRLAVSELFVLLLPVDDGVHVWSLSWTAQQHRFVPMSRPRLMKAVEAIRQSTDFAQKLQPFALEPARWLGEQLMGPLQAAVKQARHVVVAAGGELGSVPFAALPVGPASEAGEPWLIRTVAVSQVPSAGAWLAIQRLALTERPHGALMAWGDPVFDGQLLASALAHTGATRRLLTARNAALDAASLPKYSDLPALPETRDELLAIASSVKADPARDLVLGARATRASVLAANQRGELATRRVIAFATHGLMAGDLPNLNQPALALAATPDAESNPLAPLLTLDDVLGLRLNADWVVLSACNTAAADGRAEEALSGLARGFFYAGARSVLVTHWAVETESAKLLTTRTFEHYTANPYAGKAESLRQAMLSVMAMPKYQHPAFWAPYALVGDGAR